MNLTIDIGNTRAKLGLFDGGILKKQESCSHQKLKVKLEDYAEKARYVCVCSVNQKVLMDLDLDMFRDSLILSYDTPIPIDIKYKTPVTLGLDRIANVVGGAHLYPATDLLIIDVGTCITYDFLTSKHEFLGGNISPGMHLRLKAMNSYTDQLPMIELNEDFGFIGKSTEEALNNGVMNGCLEEVRFYCNKFTQEYKQGKIIITGGDTEFFGRALKNSIFAHPFLTLRGLNEILYYNIS